MGTFAHGRRDAVGPIRLADGLGVASIGLGAPMLAAPRRFLRAVGAPDGDTARNVVLGVGVREMVAAFTILGMRHRRVGAWSRVGGDLMDAGLLAYAGTQKGADREQLAKSLAAASGILAVDLLTALLLTRAEGGDVRDGSDSEGEGMAPPPETGPLHVLTAVTIGKPADEVRQGFRTYDWQAFDAEALLAEDAVAFAPAPGEQGTEVHIDWDPKKGRVGTAVAKVKGTAPDQQVHDDLRRFKMLLETGVVSRSDKSPEGPFAGRQLRQKPGNPAGRTA